MAYAGMYLAQIVIACDLSAGLSTRIQIYRSN